MVWANHMPFLLLEGDQGKALGTKCGPVGVSFVSTGVLALQAFFSFRNDHERLGMGGVIGHGVQASHMPFLFPSSMTLARKFS